MSWLQTNPRFRDAVNGRGLRCAEDFLALPGVILGGHPDRHVMMVELDDELGRCFLKKEHRVRWKSRLGSVWAGWGWASKSVREARVLERVASAGLGCPEVIAAGEADRRAFVLVRALPDAVELRDYLTACGTTARAAVARWLGKELARYVAAGFHHPDLFSKHVLVQTLVQGPRLALVDWQRGTHGRRLCARAVQAMLAGLDATLTPEWASNRDRLRCLRALLGGLPRRWSLAGMARAIRSRSQALQRQRRIREMAQAPLVLGEQNLIWLDGEALCVTRQFQAEMGRPIPPWLASVADSGDASPRIERAPIVWGDRTLRLVRRWSPSTGRHERGRTEKAFPAPEFAQAAALFRLQRFRLPLPRLLAVGHRRLDQGRRFSFLLTEPPADVVPVHDFLAEELSSLRRGAMLRQAGRLLRRLHDAGYGFGASAPVWQGWGVQVLGDDRVNVVLASVEGLQASRADGRRLARRDLPCAMRKLQRSDALRLFLGYWNLDGLRGQDRSWRRHLRDALAAARIADRVKPCERGAVS